MALVNTKNLTENPTFALEQYKLYAEMADRVSQRRATANAFFVSINSLLVAVAAFVGDDFDIYHIGVCVAGLICSVAWWVTIRSYRQLNSGKFKVILEIEQYLPFNGYAYEWEILDKGNNPRKYLQLTDAERIVPLLFILAYVGILALG